MSLHAEIRALYFATRRSVEEYHIDQAVGDGYCAGCGERRHKGDAHRRHCRKCTNDDNAARMRERRARAKKEKTA